MSTAKKNNNTAEVPAEVKAPAAAAPAAAAPAEDKPRETVFEVAASSISVGGVLPPTNKGTALKPAQVKALQGKPGKAEGSTLFGDLLASKAIKERPEKKDTPES